MVSDNTVFFRSFIYSSFCYLLFITFLEYNYLEERRIEEVFVPVGAVATIRCDTIQPSSSLTWRKDSEVLFVNERITRNSSLDGRSHYLHIKDISKYDEGIYGVDIDGRYIGTTKIIVIG
uniref:Ig-like domain-containing protein n=1 Tax=Syphacia muris TaxID=451379 RepID=A0A0N5AEP1_9BILA